MVTEDYVSFETAKLLKEKGFESDSCHTAYDCNGEFFWYGDYSKDRKGIMDAPTLQMARKWLREKHHIHANPILQGRYDDPFENYSWCVSRGGVIYRNHTVSEKLSYKQACEAAIKYCLENLI